MICDQCKKEVICQYGIVNHQRGDLKFCSRACIDAFAGVAKPTRKETIMGDRVKFIVQVMADNHYLVIGHHPDFGFVMGWLGLDEPYPPQWDPLPAEPPVAP